MNRTLQADAPAAPIPRIDEDSFDTIVGQAGAPVLVNFSTHWCTPCRIMNPILTRLACEYAGRARFVEVDVEMSPAVAEALQIRTVPTLALFMGDRVVALTRGVLPVPALRRWLDEALERVPEAAIAFESAV